MASQDADARGPLAWGLGGWALLGLALWLGAHRLLELASSVWAGPELLPVLSWVRGFPLYPPRDAGACLNPIYPPLYAWVLGPAAMLPRLDLALQAGALTGALAVLGASLGVLAPRGRRALGPALVAMLLVLAGSYGCQLSLLQCRPDGPALAFALLACLGLGRALEEEDPRWLRLAGVAGALALAGKQTFVALHPALLLAAWGGGGGAMARRLALWLLGTDLLLGLGMALCFDLAALLDHTVLLLAAHPRTGLGILASAGPTLAPALGAAGLAGLLAGRRPLRGTTGVLLLAALFQLPMALLGMAKQGGDLNQLGPPLWLLLVGALDRAASAGVFEAPGARRALWLGAFLLAARPAWELGQGPDLLARRDLTRLEMDRWEGLLRAHPGEVYVPWSAPLHLVLEGRPVHFSYALLDRELAGWPLEPAHLRAHLPERLRVVVRRRLQDHALIRHLPEYRELHRHPDFPLASFLTRPEDRVPWLP